MNWKTCFGALLALSLLVSCREKTLEERADALHARLLTLDSHNDTPLRFRLPEFDILQDNQGVCVDYPKMVAGGLDGAFFAAYIRQGIRDSLALEAATKRVFSLIEDIRTMVTEHPDQFVLATTPDDGRKIKQSGKRAVYIGVENGYAIGRNLENLDRFYDLGVRYMTLCHTRNNDICDSANDTIEEHGGLSDFGRQVVERMNRLGMMVDISHVSEASAFDAIELSAVPVIASHSCAWEVCRNPRNMSDSLLVAMAEKGGVMQLCILSSYVRPDVPNPQLDSALRAMRAHYAELAPLTPEQQRQQREDTYRIYETYPPNLASVSEAVDHIDHVVRLVGIDHVGIGTDFDGGGQLSDCKNAAQLKNITIELLRRGYSEEDIEKIWSGNLLRVMKAVQDYAVQQATASQS